jgi:hypothetical protein
MGDPGKFILLVDLFGGIRGGDRVVVVHHKDYYDGSGPRYVASWRDGDGDCTWGSGKDPREAFFSFADNLEKLAKLVREKAPPAFEMKLAPDLCERCMGEGYLNHDGIGLKPRDKCPDCDNGRKRRKALWEK